MLYTLLYIKEYSNDSQNTTNQQPARHPHHANASQTTQPSNNRPTTPTAPHHRPDPRTVPNWSGGGRSSCRGRVTHQVPGVDSVSGSGEPLHPLTLCGSSVPGWSGTSSVSGSGCSSLIRRAQVDGVSLSTSSGCILSIFKDTPGEEIGRLTLCGGAVILENFDCKVEIRVGTSLKINYLRSPLG